MPMFGMKSKKEKKKKWFSTMELETGETKNATLYADTYAEAIKKTYSLAVELCNSRKEPLARIWTEEVEPTTRKSTKAYIRERLKKIGGLNDE
jgi:ABC-type ATPase with predicted acetyltransferase domain